VPVKPQRLRKNGTCQTKVPAGPVTMGMAGKSVLEDGAYSRTVREKKKREGGGGGGGVRD
jgi:hypothetical protein